MARAVIICPNAAGRWRDHWLTLCVDYCAEHGYEVVGVTETWSSALRMREDDEAEIIVAAKREHLPPSPVPWLEIVADQR